MPFEFNSKTELMREIGSACIIVLQSEKNLLVKEFLPTVRETPARFTAQGILAVSMKALL